MSRAAVALVLVGGLCGPVPGAPARASKAGAERAALEQKLHGEWAGQGPCDGGLAFRADGTYERTRHGPAGVNSSGTWKVRWDALPPTLVLTCRESDDPDSVGKAAEVKLVQLDDETMAFSHPEARDPAKPTRFSRAKK